ncbi:MAG: hypothetical protein IH969_05165 [Candidatus Krumholzibacteriota bacterium]|nr:hypothetical protein [Candidatus Krumholzibacteriota bacterium]
MLTDDERMGLARSVNADILVIGTIYLYEQGKWEGPTRFGCQLSAVEVNTNSPLIVADLFEKIGNPIVQHDPVDDLIRKMSFDFAEEVQRKLRK